jgi:outer membrane protein TolC
MSNRLDSRCRCGGARPACTEDPRRARARRLRLALMIVFAAGLGGCATYQAKPLPARPDFLSDPARIIVDSRTLPLPELREHRFDAADGLDMTEVAMLAVVNNPGLRAARAQAAVAHAQAFAAGLLPDPQLSASRDVPRNSDPTLTSAYSVGLAYDLNMLVTHGAARQAATETARQTDLELLWKEWQVVAQARSLFARLTTGQRLLALLQRQQELFRTRYERSHRAFERGDLTVDKAAAYLTALQGADKQINDLERRINDDRHALNALLGLDPVTRLKLDNTLSLPPLDDGQILLALPELPRRRPDLLALQAGYQAQEQRVRAAILAQFPAFNLALTRSRDTSNIHTQGLAIALTLPLFNGNRGAIAVEKATRARLYAEYQARLDAACGDVHRLLANQKLLEAQKAELARNLEQLQRVARAARKAYREGIMDTLQYVNLETSLIGAQMEALRLDELMLQQRVGLQLLMGGELPVKRQDAEGSS